MTEANHPTARVCGFVGSGRARSASGVRADMGRLQWSTSALLDSEGFCVGSPLRSWRSRRSMGWYGFSHRC